MTHPFEDDIAFYYEEMGRVGTAGPWKGLGSQEASSLFVLGHVPPGARLFTDSCLGELARISPHWRALAASTDSRHLRHARH